jgi:hypothetical protein
MKPAPMDGETELLVEMMLQAELFCAKLEGRAKARGRSSEADELRLKISQCRGYLATLQEAFETDQLALSHPPVAGYFRQLVMALLWVAHLGKADLNFRDYRKLVQIESGLTYLLLQSNTTQPPA